MKNQILKQYFTLPRKERTAALVVSFCMVVGLSLPYWYQPKKQLPKVDNAVLQQLEMAATPPTSYEKPYASTANKNSSTTYTTDDPITKAELFTFDPNTLDAVGWKKLGLRDKTINTLLNYRNKGGKFRSAEDIRKIWGLRPDEADRIIPYARVSQPTYPNKKPYETNKPFSKQEAAITATPKNKVLEINTMTAYDLKGFIGMENGMNYRIIKFRDKLGGFLQVDQIKETYGLSDSAFQLLLPHLSTNNIPVKQLSINAASETELEAHPYISVAAAKAIIAYRTQHGLFSSVDDLKKISYLRTDALQRMMPYLKID